MTAYDQNLILMHSD